MKSVMFRLGAVVLTFMVGVTCNNVMTLYKVETKAKVSEVIKEPLPKLENNISEKSKLNKENEKDESLEIEIKKLVEEISWDSVGGKCWALMWMIEPTGYAAERLIEIGKPATNELLKVLVDKNKGVAAHIILTKIYKVNYSWSTKYVFKENDIIGSIYEFNHLEWTEFNTKVRLIDEKALIKNSQRWKEKILLLQSASE